MMRRSSFVLVLLALGAAGRADGDHAMGPSPLPAHPAFPTILFETATEGDDAGTHEIIFDTEIELKPPRVTVIQIGSRWVRTVPADLLKREEGGATYRAVLPDYPAEKSRGHGDVLVLAPPPRTKRLVRVSDTDRRALSKLKGQGFTDVSRVFPWGLPGTDGRVALALVEACVEYPRSDGICASHRVYAFLRNGLHWQAVALHPD